MKKMKRQLSLFCTFLLLTACSPKGSLPVIDLSTGIKNLKTSDLADYIDTIEVIEIKSDNYFIKDLSLIGENGNRIFGYSSNGDVLIFSKEGILLNKINNKGRGPQEYISIWEAKLDNFHQQILLLDFRNKILKYSLEGEFLAEYANDLVKKLVCITPTGDGNYAGTLNNYGNKQYKVAVFDPACQLTQTYFPVSEVSDRNTSGMINLENIFLCNSKAMYKPNTCDTVYSILTTGAQPEFIIQQGALEMPPELAIKVGNNTDNEKARYIANLYGRVAGNLYLAYYQYNREEYYDLYDISTGEAIIHRKLNDQLYDEGEREGFLLSVNGKNLYIWPKYVQDNTLYCVADHTDLYDSVSEADENRNPYILKITLKNQPEN